MKIINRTMRNKDRKIEVTHYVPASPKASIQIFHGMAEHKDRYRELLTYLALNDIHCVIYNQRGHGPDEKKEKLGHFDSFEDLLSDAKVVFRSMPTDIPRFGLGHSMGSIVLRRLLADDLYDGAIIVGTGSKPNFKDLLAEKFLKVLSLIIPRKQLTSLNKLSFLGYDGNFKGREKNRWLNQDVSEIVKYNSDPYSGQNMSVKALSEILKNIRYVDRIRHIRRYKDIPYYLIGGADDPFSHFGRDLEVLRFRLGLHYSKVDLMLEPNARHEVLFEENKVGIYARIVKWVLDYEQK